MEKPVDRSPYYLSISPTNREQRRQVIHELKRWFPDLFEIEKQFLVDLFSENNIPYHRLYKFYLDHYKEMVERVQKRGKLKCTAPNPHYFSNVYQPVEKPFSYAG